MDEVNCLIGGSVPLMIRGILRDGVALEKSRTVVLSLLDGRVALGGRVLSVIPRDVLFFFPPQLFVWRKLKTTLRC